MSTVRVRKKSQITLPAKASAALGIAENDLLEVEITGQIIILRPRRGEAAAKVARLPQYAGMGAGLSANPDMTVNDIRKDREAWK